MPIATASPGRSPRAGRSARRSTSVFDTIANTAVVAPCSTAVPRPRTIHRQENNTDDRHHRQNEGPDTPGDPRMDPTGVCENEATGGIALGVQLQHPAR